MICGMGPGDGVGKRGFFFFFFFWEREVGVCVDGGIGGRVGDVCWRGKGKGKGVRNCIWCVRVDGKRKHVIQAGVDPSHFARVFAWGYIINLPTLGTLSM